MNESIGIDAPRSTVELTIGGDFRLNMYLYYGSMQFDNGKYRVCFYYSSDKVLRNMELPPGVDYVRFCGEWEDWLAENGFHLPGYVR